MRSAPAATSLLLHSTVSAASLRLCRVSFVALSAASFRLRGFRFALYRRARRRVAQAQADYNRRCEQRHQFLGHTFTPFSILMLFRLRCDGDIGNMKIFCLLEGR